MAAIPHVATGLFYNKSKKWRLSPTWLQAFYITRVRRRLSPTWLQAFYITKVRWRLSPHVAIRLIWLRSRVWSCAATWWCWGTTTSQAGSTSWRFLSSYTCSTSGRWDNPATEKIRHFLLENLNHPKYFLSKWLQSMRHFWKVRKHTFAMYDRLQSSISSALLYFWKVRESFYRCTNAGRVESLSVHASLLEDFLHIRHF